MLPPPCPRGPADRLSLTPRDWLSARLRTRERSSMVVVPSVGRSGSGCTGTHTRTRVRNGGRRGLPSMRTFRRELDPSAEPDRVVAWRIDRGRDAGFPAHLADALARDSRYDVHALLELTDRGFSAEGGSADPAFDRGHAARAESRAGPLERWPGVDRSVEHLAWRGVPGIPRAGQRDRPTRLKGPHPVHSADGVSGRKRRFHRSWVRPVPTTTQKRT